MDTSSREITEADMAVLDGTISEVPHLSSNIVRVFLSSTFSDMSEERNMLLKHVYPRLKEYTMKKYGAIFQMVDMRWGVTSEAQNDQMTSEVCLNEIRNCQKLSAGPNFVALIGQKYGYRPIPAIIDAEEFDILRQQLLEHEEDVNILDLWYLRDDNAVPSQYVLQPINSILKNYDSSDEDLKTEAREEWDDSFQEMNGLLKRAADFAFDAGLIGGQTKEKYYLSVTEEEIQAGMFEYAGDVNMKCLCFTRTIEGLFEHTNNVRAAKFIDLVTEDDGSKSIDTEAQDLLKGLRESKIPERLNPANIVRLSTKWSESGGINSVDNADYLDHLAEVFYSKMIWIIDQNLHDAEDLRNDEQTVEVNQSLKIREEWSSIFYGREDILKSVNKYLQDWSCRLPLVLYGESGCGKTAVIAKCTQLTPSWITNSTPATVVRFLGTSPRSSHILLTLQSLCTQICDIYQYRESSVPSDFEDVVSFFAKVLELPTADRPLVIYIDSLDQLSSSCDPHNLRWLPRTLPKHTKMIVSLIPDHFNLLKKFRAYLANTTNGEKCIVQIPQLGDQLSIEILRARLKTIDRTISKQQEEVVATLFSKQSLPLFSSIMFEEVRLWKSYTTIREHMVSASINSALNKMFERLEMQHGRVLVHHALAYVTAARDGVSEMELLDLLSLDDDVLSSIFLFWLPPVRRLPNFLLTKLKIDLDKFIVVREAGDQDVVVWYHRQFREAAGDRYLRDKETRRLIHENMADYFLGTWGGGRKKPFTFSPFLKSRLALTSDTGEEDRNVPEQPLEIRKGNGSHLYNKRKMSELPFHLVRCGKMDVALSNCVFNYTWLYTKLKAGGLQPVLEDLEFISSFKRSEEVQTLNDALRIAGSTLNNFPENLTTEVTGRLIDFYDTSPNIRALIQQCDVLGAQHSAFIAPFQLFDLPITALAKTLEGSYSEISDMQFLRNGAIIASLHVDGSLRLWDIKHGEVVKELKMPNLKSVSWLNMRLLKSADERFLICKGKPSKNETTVVRSDTLDIVFSHRGGEQQKHNLLASQNYVCMENALFDIRSGKKIHSLNDYKKVQDYVNVAITHDDVHILIGSQTVVDIFTITKAKKVKTLELTNTASVIKISSDGRLAVVGQTVDCKIKLFDLSIESVTFGEEVVTYDPKTAFPSEKFVEDTYATNEVSELCISNKGKSFVSLVKRKYPIVWSLKNVSTKPKLLAPPHGNEPVKYLFNFQFSADDSFILAAELSTNVIMWDAMTGQLLSLFAAHQNDVHRVVLSKKSNIAATIAQSDTAMKFWDLHQFQKKGKMSTRKERAIPAQNITFSNKSNLVFISRVQPLKSSKGYHFIDHFGIDVFNLKTGEMEQLLPFEKYGVFQHLAVSKDASVMVITTGTATQSVLTILDMATSKIVDTLIVPRFKTIKLSADGKYLATFAHDINFLARIYQVHDEGIKELGSYERCLTGMFSNKGMFIGVTSNREILVRETMDDEETLKLTLQGDVKTLHYCDTTEVLLVTVDDDVTVYTSVFKTDGFGTIGTMTDVSKAGICDVASDGSICIDADLQVFELKRCKRVKRILTGRRKGVISSVRLSRNGEFAVYVDTKPTDCIKVCRISDSTCVATCSLHCIPECIELVPSSNVVVAIGKNNSLFIMALNDEDRKGLSDVQTRAERLTEILGTSQEKSNGPRLTITQQVQAKLIENTKSLQMRNFNLKLKRTDSADPNPAPLPPKYAKKKADRSSACSIV